MANTAAKPEVAFDAIVPIDLAAVFDRFLFVPGVRGYAIRAGRGTRPVAPELSC